jgi:thioredoxin 2
MTQDAIRVSAVSARLGVQGIPTMLLFVGGAEVGRQVGALPGAALRSWIDQTLTG